jgi:uncharacterized protein (TIGR02001 family)
MKKTALILALLATRLGLNAQESKLSYSVTVDFPYASKYVFRGIEYAKDSIQPSIEVASGNFYAGVWTNQPVTNNSDNEFDFYAGYGIPLNDKWKHRCRCHSLLLSRKPTPPALMNKPSKVSSG